jgi:uncharacterized protein YegL
MLRPAAKFERKDSICNISTEIDIRVENSISAFRIAQIFTNSTSSPLECEYEIPLPSDSVLSSLQFTFQDGTILRSIVKDKQKASEEYQDALAQGNFTAVANQEPMNNIVVSVGNLSPMESVTVNLDVYMALKVEDGFWLAEGLKGLAEVQGTKCTAQIQSLTPIIEYNSSWKFDWRLSEDNRNLFGVLVNDLSGGNDLKIQYKNEEPFVPTCLIQRKGEKIAAMLSFIPLNSDRKRVEFIEGTGEYIFLIDRSGSMEGQRIHLAKQSALLFLKSLPSDSKFNIISFGSQSIYMFPESQQNTTETIAYAISEISQMCADMGGTDIYSALQKAFDLANYIDYPRTIFLITDGGDNNQVASFRAITNNKTTSKVYGFGIDSTGKHAQFIEDASKLGGGCAYFVEKVEDLNRKIIQALSKCVMPCMKTWRINWPGDSVPKSNEIGSIYYGERFIQYCLMEIMPSSLPELQYFDTYEKVEKTVRLEFIKEIEGEELFKLWAKNKIDELETQEIKAPNEVIRLSIDYQVLSQETSLICTKEKEGIIHEDLIVCKLSPFKQNIYNRPIPNSGPVFSGHYWQTLCRSSYSPISTAPVSTKIQGSTVGLQEFYPKLLHGKRDSHYERVSDPQSSGPSTIETTSSRETNLVTGNHSRGVEMHERSYEMAKKEQEATPNSIKVEKGSSKQFFDIIQSMKPEGFWNLAVAISIIDAEIERDSCSNIGDDEFATVFMLCYLENIFAGRADEWLLVKRKAIKWLHERNVCYDDEKIHVRLS